MLSMIVMDGHAYARNSGRVGHGEIRTRRNGMLALDLDFAAQVQEESSIGNVDQGNVRNLTHRCANLFGMFHAAGGNRDIADRMAGR